MTDDTMDDFFTAKHERLTRIASISNLFAWIVLNIHILWIGFRFLQIQNAEMLQNMNFGQHASFLEMLHLNPLFLAGLALELVIIFLQGCVYGLLLKGVSLGLNMIVEIDLNYRERSLVR